MLQGFTLIKLMVVLGILVASTVPVYNDYLTRAHVAEAITLEMVMKQHFGDYGWARAVWPTKIISGATLPTDTDIKATRQGNYFNLIDTVLGTYPQDTITVTLINSRTSGQSILLLASDGASWSCIAGTLQAQYRPIACR
jgi:type IV pilus assembly protein PilA